MVLSVKSVLGSPLLFLISNLSLSLFLSLQYGYRFINYNDLLKDFIFTDFSLLFFIFYFVDFHTDICGFLSSSYFKFNLLFFPCFFLFLFFFF